MDPSSNKNVESEIDHIHNDNAWSPSTLPTMSDLRQTDLTLVVDSRKFHVHKDVLIKSSDYFAAMFSSQMIEAVKDVIDLHLVGSEQFKVLIEGIYTGNLELTEDNAFDIAEVAQMLHVCPALEAQYIDFMKQNMINETHSLELMYFCIRFCIQEIYCDVRRFCVAHFSELRLSSSFLKLSVSELHDYLSDKYLVVDHELHVVEAIHHWITANLSSHEYDILHSQIKRIVSSCVHVKNEEAFDSIIEAVFRVGNLEPETFQLMLAHRARQEDIFMFWSLLTTSRIHDGLVDVVKLCLETGVAVKCGSMKDVVDKPGFILGSAMCVSGPCVYLSGGGPSFGNLNWIREIWMFDVSKPSLHWEAVGNLVEFRRCHAMVSIQKKLYIFGGFGKFRVKNSQLDCFNLVTGNWEILAPMPKHEMNPMTTTLDNRIFYISKDWMLYSYNTITKEWTGLSRWETVPYRPPSETIPVALFQTKTDDVDCFAILVFADNVLKIPLMCPFRGAVKLCTHEDSIVNIENTSAYGGSVAMNKKLAVFFTTEKYDDIIYEGCGRSNFQKVLIFDPKKNEFNGYLPVKNVKTAQTILALPYLPSTYKIGNLDFK